MKKIAIACALALALPLAAQQRVPVQTPDFRSATEAYEWAQQRLAKGADQESLLAATLAFSKARAWPDAPAQLRADAALGEADTYLRLKAPKNAMRALDSVPHDVIARSGRVARVKERAGEAAELMGYRDSALATYEEGLRAPEAEPAWRSLLLYRSGMAAHGLGQHAKAAARLEEAAEKLGDTSPRGVAARAALARSYAKLEDGARATAWATASQRALGRLTQTATNEGPATFVTEPTKDQLEKHLAETASLIRR